MVPSMHPKIHPQSRISSYRIISEIQLVLNYKAKKVINALKRMKKEK
jgi:hypothetical protein